jgi:hypothetical protein
MKRIESSRKCVFGRGGRRGRGLKEKGSQDEKDNIDPK